MTTTGSFFTSRWIDAPDNVTELPGGLPKGFRAAGVACGIKPSGAPDLGIMACSSPRTTSAARFTRSGTQSAPVLLCRERCRLDAIRAIVVNSGNANAATGRGGLDDAAKMQGAAAIAAGAGSEEQVAVASTGRDRRPAADGLRDERDRQRRPRPARRRRRRVRRGDPHDRRVRQARLPRRRAVGRHRAVDRPGQGRGDDLAGLRHAVVFVQTDAVLSPATCDLLLAVTVKRSFERISVDGQLSTSDTVIVQCSGESGVAVEPETDDELHFGEAIDAVLRQLALSIVRDGEGARRVGRVVVRGGDEGAVERGRARGRRLAAGQDRALRRRSELGPDRPGRGNGAARDGAAAAGHLDRGRPGVLERTVCAPRPRRAVGRGAAATRSSTRSALPGEGAEAERYFSDLGHEYVTINAEYTT